MDEPFTVFYLFPQNTPAEEIVDDPANAELRRENPNNPQEGWLRIGLDRKPKMPPFLARFGRTPATNDVILGEGWSKNDQCYFDFNTETGELLLHDISARTNTRIAKPKERVDQLQYTPRQCVVLSGTTHTFEIGRATFTLIPHGFRDNGQPTKQEKLDFVQQPVSGELDGTYEATIERLLCDQMEDKFNGFSTANCSRILRVIPPAQIERPEIRYAAVRSLGRGGQGQVQEVVDLFNGDHYALKTLNYKAFPASNVTSEHSIKKKILKEVELVKKMKHVSSFTLNFFAMY